PLAIEGMKNSYLELSRCFASENEMTISWTGEKIVLDGAPLNNLASVEQSLKALFEKFQLNTLNFKKEVSEQELNSFYKLLALKEGAIKDQQALKEYLAKENVRNIELTQAIYARVSGDKASVRSGSGAGAGASAESAGA